MIVETGDGDLFSIGAGHNPHAARRNIDITVICMDNQVYGLTKNQISPTSREGLYGSLTHDGDYQAGYTAQRFLFCECDISVPYL